MKHLSFVAGTAILLAAVHGHAQSTSAPKPTRPPAGYSRVVPLWGGEAPGAVGKEDQDIPKLYIYAATGEARTRSAVIVMPGGGYRSLVMEKEGAAEARWLNSHGVDAFVLQYRLGPRYHFPVPIEDGARAVRYVRSHAAELGINPSHIGVWGFSAGGHLAGYLAAIHDQGNSSAEDSVDRVSDRPDFAILSYARLSMDPSIPRSSSMEGLLGDSPSVESLQQISVAPHVTKDTSPSFIYSTSADQTVNPLNATAYYDAMKRAGAPVELHIFERGPHGTGMGQNLKGLEELQVLPSLVEDWMQMHGWM